MKISWSAAIEVDHEKWVDHEKMNSGQYSSKSLAPLQLFLFALDLKNQVEVFAIIYHLS